MTVDLTGTAPQVDDRPINMPLEGTVDCAIWLTLRSILLDSAVYGNVPRNMGSDPHCRAEGNPCEPQLPSASHRAFLSGQCAR
jgi:N-methylhydantoinase B